MAAVPPVPLWIHRVLLTRPAVLSPAAGRRTDGRKRESAISHLATAAAVGGGAAVVAAGGGGGGGAIIVAVVLLTHYHCHSNVHY